MRSWSFGIVAAAGLASLIATFAGAVTVIGLPLAAATVVFAIAVSRPRGWAWRFALLGSIAWMVEEIAWAVKRYSGFETATFLTDASYFTGVVLWCAALLLMRGRRLRTSLWLLMLPALAIVVWMLAVQTSTSLELQFPYIDALMLVVAVPALEPALRGRASEGRVLIVLAFFIRAVGSSAFAWLFDTTGLDAGATLVWILAYVALAVGAWLELSGEPAQMFVAASSVIALQMVAGATVHAVLLIGRPLEARSVGVLLLLGYCQLVVLLIIAYTQRMRWTKADRELRAWSSLVTDLGTLDPDAADSTTSLGRFVRALRERIPSLRGLVLHEKEDLLVGETGTYAYPLVAGGTEVGRLHFDGQPQQLDVLDAVSPFLAGRLRQSQLAAEWVDQALADPLTSILNRRGFAVRAGRLVGMAQANSVRMTVVMFDIDHFKRVNDFYGHGVGDDALQALSKVLQSNLRPNDLAIRWGGEEFVVVLYDATREIAAEVVKRVRSDLRDKKVPPIDWSLTFSAGLAGGTTPASLAEVESWIDDADTALRRAKAAGRDRLEVVA
ncbi:MAG TPA: GGDEF domain-containing protein [Trueperaceae bacterium]|nr:GGDEF domain-containing protein [Trueperaceae bacterium]